MTATVVLSMYEVSLNCLIVVGTTTVRGGVSSCPIEGTQRQNRVAVQSEWHIALFPPVEPSGRRDEPKCDFRPVGREGGREREKPSRAQQSNIVASDSI